MRVAWRTCLRSRSAGVAAVAAAGLALASCSSAPPASSPGANTSSRSGSVISLTSISTLKTLFDRDNGHPRLVLILSPT